METYALKMPGNIYCGENAADQIISIVRGKYKKAAVFTDTGIVASGVIKIPVAKLEEAGVQIEIINKLPSEPTYTQAQEIIDTFRRSHADLIVAVGGGSVMDIAKLASIAATEEYKVADLLDHPMLGKKRVPTMMIPTTAGTGSEATPNSIVAVPEKELKVGIVNEEMLADYVILDGAMIRNLPLKIAASTGVDALCHAIECYTSVKANPFSDLFAMKALELIFKNIEKACTDHEAIAEKNNMLLAAFYGGVAITASGTTAVHALSYPLGGKYHIPHGVANAIMLLPVMKFNQAACDAELSAIYDMLGGVITADRKTKSAWVIDRIEGMIRRLSLPTTLAGYGVDQNDLDGLVAAGMDVKRLLVNNKRTVTPEDARKLYMEVLE
jgi:alcohol dehydrogenase class IV